MSLIYKKTLKGVEEIALRSNNLQMRLRVYLILVDGIKSVEMIQASNPTLAEVEMVLNALHDEGYLQVASNNSSDAGRANPINKDLPGYFQPTVNQFNSAPASSQFQAPTQFQSPAQSSNLPYANTIQNVSNKNNANDQNAQFLQARDAMIREMTALLGKDAEMVVGKISRCENGMDLFAMMMGLKKIITMYANSDNAESFANKFSYVATL